MTSKLELELISAINDEDIEELQRILNICDMLHKGIAKIEYYTEKDLPSDMKYEEGIEKLKSLLQLDLLVNGKTVSLNEYNPNYTIVSATDRGKITKEELLYMDGIELKPDIPELEDVILMPKFDGCSIGTELLFSNNSVNISKAHTRGSDDLTGCRNFKDKTDYINIVSSNMVKRINKILSSNKSLKMKLNYKDVSLQGNYNPPLSTKIDLHKLDCLIIRGEFVSNNKNNCKLDGLPETQVGLAAGAINSKADNFEKYKDYVCYIPFEIALVRVYDEEEDKLKEFVPTQLSALRILKKLQMIDYPVYIEDSINEAYDMEKLLVDMEKIIDQPLDGVVYCKTNWTYPLNKNENGKHVDYGKYKWKRHNVKQTKILSVEYSIGKTGNITPSIIFETVNMNNKNYKRSKTTFNKLEEYNNECLKYDKVFGQGLVCNVELKADINPFIEKVFPSVSKNIIPIELISTCPYCGEKLTKNDKITNKNRVITLSCENDKCSGVVSQKIKEFLKLIQYKGCGDKTILNIKDLITFEQIYNKNIKHEIFDNIIKSLSTGNLIIALSLCDKKHLNNLLSPYKIDSEDIFIENMKTKHYKRFIKYLKEETDYITNNIITFILNKYDNGLILTKHINKL